MMKKEFSTLWVMLDETQLNMQERGYFRRMIDTLKAVDVQVVGLSVLENGTQLPELKNDMTKDPSLCSRDWLDKVVVLVADEHALAQAKARNLPVVYYSNECIGGYGADMLLMSFGEIGFDFYQQIFDRFHGQPWTILETRRCVLREAVLSDLNVFYEIYRQPSVARFLEPLSQNYQEEQEKLQAYIKNQYPFYGFGTWTILGRMDSVKDTADLDMVTDASKPYDAPLAIIGRAGLNVSETTGNVQLGYVIREEYQGQGIAEEVCLAILQYAKKELDLTEVELEVDTDNIASMKLAKKLGFKPVCKPSACCNLLRISL